MNKLDPILYVHHFKRNVETERERKKQRKIGGEKSNARGDEGEKKKKKIKGKRKTERVRKKERKKERDKNCSETIE